MQITLFKILQFLSRWSVYKTISAAFYPLWIRSFLLIVLYHVKHNQMVTDLDFIFLKWNLQRSVFIFLTTLERSFFLSTHRPNLPNCFVNSFTNHNKCEVPTLESWTFYIPIVGTCSINFWKAYFSSELWLVVSLFAFWHQPKVC